jgi:hypothetical protein
MPDRRGGVVLRPLRRGGDVARRHRPGPQARGRGRHRPEYRGHGRLLPRARAVRRGPEAGAGGDRGADPPRDGAAGDALSGGALCRV